MVCRLVGLGCLFGGFVTFGLWLFCWVCLGCVMWFSFGVLGVWFVVLSDFAWWCGYGVLVVVLDGGGLRWGVCFAWLGL